jgi:hypothetical protein
MSNMSNIPWFIYDLYLWFIIDKLFMIGSHIPSRCDCWKTPWDLADWRAVSARVYSEIGTRKHSEKARKREPNETVRKLFWKMQWHVSVVTVVEVKELSNFFGSWPVLYHFALFRILCMRQIDSAISQAFLTLRLSLFRLPQWCGRKWQCSNAQSLNDQIASVCRVERWQDMAWLYIYINMNVIDYLIFLDKPPLLGEHIPNHVVTHPFCSWTTSICFTGDDPLKLPLLRSDLTATLLPVSAAGCGACHVDRVRMKNTNGTTNGWTDLGSEFILSWGFRLIAGWNSTRSVSINRWCSHGDSQAHWGMLYPHNWNILGYTLESY